MVTRRGLAAGLVGLAKKAPRAVAGGFADDSHLVGHRLRDGAAFGAARREVRVPAVIVGGGVAGLCCAWHLKKRGFSDFVLLEMEKQAGGNSRWGENEVSAYPWGAHYLPVPGAGAELVRELCEEFGLLRGGEFEERHLCHTPQERLFLHGRWQEGLEPEIGSTKRDHAQFRRFQELVGEARGMGEFSIPMERRAPRASKLDEISMAVWMRERGLDSAYLRWYVDYATRDDYGARAEDCSAWAALHYFAARDSKEGPLTWPEGNGWLVKRLLERVGSHVRPGSFVNRVTRDGRGWRVRTGETEYRAEAVVFAAPSYLAKYLVESAPPADGFVYSPWLVANLTLDRPPAERGIEPAWDNVIYGSPSLGYVVATHQSLRTRVEKTVWTYYWALADGAPRDVRRMLLERPWKDWVELIMTDLQRAHPDIRECVSRVDIMRFGHAMARPVPGFLRSESRIRLARAEGSLVYANSDLSGLSLFEEAQYRGVAAADRVLRR